MVEGGQSVYKTNVDQSRLYGRLVKEESEELNEALTNWLEFPTVESKADLIKEAMDVLVVAAGFVHSLGLDGQQINDAWSAVHESNMSKVTGDVTKREDGKILKSAEYKAAAKAKLMDTLYELVSSNEE
jgi:predicted HAD superfamily Cof-like phosphohydrolase